MSEEKLNVEAFNQGYLIKKHMNKEYYSIAKAVEKNQNYGIYFIEGGNEAAKEIEQQRLQQLSELRKNSFQRDREIDLEP